MKILIINGPGFPVLDEATGSLYSDHDVLDAFPAVLGCTPDAHIIVRPFTMAEPTANHWLMLRALLNKLFDAKPGNTMLLHGWPADSEMAKRFEATCYAELSPVATAPAHFLRSVTDISSLRTAEPTFGILPVIMAPGMEDALPKRPTGTAYPVTRIAMRQGYTGTAVPRVAPGQPAWYIIDSERENGWLAGPVLELPHQLHAPVTMSAFLEAIRAGKEDGLFPVAGGDGSVVDAPETLRRLVAQAGGSNELAAAAVDSYKTGKLTALKELLNV